MISFPVITDDKNKSFFYDFIIISFMANVFMITSEAFINLILLDRSYLLMFTLYDVTLLVNIWVSLPTLEHLQTSVLYERLSSFRGTCKCV